MLHVISVISSTEEQQELITKAKETITAATNKCKDVENKMKVCVCIIPPSFCYFRRPNMFGFVQVCLRAIPLLRDSAKTNANKIEFVGSFFLRFSGIEACEGLDLIREFLPVSA